MFTSLRETVANSNTVLGIPHIGLHIVLLSKIVNWSNIAYQCAGKISGQIMHHSIDKLSFCLLNTVYGLWFRGNFISLAGDIASSIRPKQVKLGLHVSVANVWTKSLIAYLKIHIINCCRSSIWFNWACIPSLAF